MQNTSDSQLVLFNPRLRGANTRLSRAIMLCALLACVALAIVAAAPSTAWAKSYDMTKVDITAQAETDGSLHAVEQRTFDFNGDFTAVWWTFSGLPSNAQLQVNSMRMARVGADGAVEGEWKTLPSVPFVLSWRDVGGPGTEAYSVDKPLNAVYAFFNVSDERLMIELDYTVINGVQAYEDVGEVYWKYIGSQWEEDSDNVTMTLALPVPQGVEVVPGDNVLAWGHGPLDGTVTINSDGTVTYHNPHVNAGQYAEARVLFPVSWLTNLSPEALKAHQGVARLEQAKTEEQAWADQANRERTNALLLLIGCGVVCVLLIAWALWSYFRYGREHKPDFTDEYWRDVPAPGVHPAVIGRLWRWNRESQNDFTATLMHLSHIGALRIDRGSYQEPKAFGRLETVEDYYFTRVPAVADAVTDPIDRATLDLLFDVIAGGTDSLWFGSIQKYGKDHPEPFLDAMKGWQGVVEAETNRHDYFEFKGKRYQGLLIGLGVAVFIIGLLMVAVLQNFLLLAFTLPTAIALIVIGNYMPRRSVEGNNLVAKCKALRNWLRDFSTLDERPPTDVKVWGEFMVYAYIFGIAKQVMSELQTKMPELFDGEAGAYGYGVPWWFWYSPLYGSHGQAMPSGGDLLQTAMANTMASAQAAISGASGNFSSGGGFGGGFSGGGGGGFGGGGGAR
ncbi:MULTISPECIES: DUF2207 domain-containing protein [Gordonibacter]|uniref:DUF2207 domain-containing protein n=1 Tax=Gordonibacter faecis TaxID=3047475 RepID=A0ABT7DKF6_9ACTN|nr:MULTISPECIES: DUF2207 domain-containing protein [unclassified Gordonibacter]MDJ1650009.1 DUF2207 domain-containing protein [Gordonibacter sp. KGMB12511]